MQSWGTDSKLQIRRTDAYPSKSGVLGMVLCAMGVPRDKAPEAVKPLAELMMGVRIDRPGISDWDYHTAGAGVGIRQASGGVKRTATTGEVETLLSRRQYLLDASFLVALHGNESVIEDVAKALQSPKWPIFLGRKCCIPSERVFDHTESFEDVRAALESVPFFTDHNVKEGDLEEVDALIEHAAGTQRPQGAILVHDVPRTLRYPSHGPRFIVPTILSVPLRQREHTKRISKRRRVDYTSTQWKKIRKERLEYDNGLCVFCKAPAKEVHHVTYENVGNESVADLRSLCSVCHDACTQLEYGKDMKQRRVDPADKNQREVILNQVNRILAERRVGRRKAILEMSRKGSDFLTNAPG